MAGKIRLGLYSYTYARVCAMKSKLLKRDDYNRLMKMKFNETTKFLHETEYKKEIDELAVSFSGIDLIERALNKNLAAAFMKLKRISEGNLIHLIDAYLRRWDMNNLKIIFRGKFTNAENDYIESLLLPVGKFDKNFLMSLVRKESIEEIIKAIKFIDLKGAFNDFKENNSLFEIENELDKYYYNEVLEFTKKIPRQGKLFKDFLKYEIDILNIMTILRLKKEESDKKDIEKYLFFSGKKLDKETLLKLISMDNTEDIFKRLRKFGYGKIIEEGIEQLKKEDSLTGIEKPLNNYLLNQAILLFHQHPLSVDVILGYMFAKQIEVKNLMILIKGKLLGLEEDFISNELIIAK